MRFCQSSLWTRQALQTFPAALPERQFVVPNENLLSHSERRNLTDLQETAQWMGGKGVPLAILEALTGSLVIIVQCYFHQTNPDIIPMFFIL